MQCFSVKLCDIWGQSILSLTGSGRKPIAAYHICIMKTSATQFEMMVNFMQQHGDLNKPTSNARGRMQTIQEWESLTNILNNDPTGERKTTEKWKKVWSDLKNNTKRKAAKINRAACGTGGGPALQIHLTDIEERVLNIIGSQAATGLLGVVEAGFQEEDVTNVESDRTITLPPSPPQQFRTQASPPASSMSPFSLLAINIPEPDIESPVITIAPWIQPGTSREPHIPPPPTYQSPVPPTSNEPAAHGHTPRRRRPAMAARSRLSPRQRRRPQSQVDRVAQNFHKSDEEWRSHLIEKSRREFELEQERLRLDQERLRLRELEINLQQQWQEVAMKAVDALHKIIDSKLCK